MPHETAAVSAQVLCTPYNHAPIYFMQSHIRKVYACLATRNYSVVILTKSGLPLLTAVRDFVCMHHLNPAYLQENYLDFVRIKCFRDVLIKLRMGMLPLNADRYRYAHENASKILCSVCESETEDEEHFICSSEIHPPRRYLQTEQTFTLLMQCHEKSSSQTLAYCVFETCEKT